MLVNPVQPHRPVRHAVQSGPFSPLLTFMQLEESPYLSVIVQ